MVISVVGSSVVELTAVLIVVDVSVVVVVAGFDWVVVGSSAVVSSVIAVELVVEASDEVVGVGVSGVSEVVLTLGVFNMVEVGESVDTTVVVVVAATVGVVISTSGPVVLLGVVSGMSLVTSVLVVAAVVVVPPPPGVVSGISVATSAVVNAGGVAVSFGQLYPSTETHFFSIGENISDDPQRVSCGTI